MLRKSFARGTIRAIYVGPLQSLLMALLTAGVWPTGLLLTRLWLYASFQRFRGGELARWAAYRNGVRDEPYAHLVRRIRPTGVLVFAGVFWIVAAAAGLVIVVSFARWHLGWSPPLPADPRRCAPMVVLMVAGFATSIFHILAVLQIRLKMSQLIGRLAIWQIVISKNAGKADLPGFVLWPQALFVVAAPLLWLHWRWSAYWLIAAVAAMLAAEVQRGYITVADRRLRIAVARAIGRIMYGPGARR